MMTSITDSGALKRSAEKGAYASDVLNDPAHVRRLLAELASEILRLQEQAHAEPSTQIFESFFPFAASV
jgi:hypothetical protein